MSELAPGFHTVRASDLRRDGMILELIDSSLGDEVGEVFYSDESGDMTVSLFRQDLPLDIVSKFIQRAQADLTPNT